jgi:hypothetical protein
MFSHDLTHMFSLDVVPTLSGPVCMQLGHSCPCLRQAHTHSIVYIYHRIHDSRVRLRPVQPSDHYRIGTTGFGLPYAHYDTSPAATAASANAAKCKRKQQPGRTLPTHRLSVLAFAMLVEEVVYVCYRYARRAYKRGQLEACKRRLQGSCQVGWRLLYDAHDGSTMGCIFYVITVTATIVGTSSPKLTRALLFNFPLIWGACSQALRFAHLACDAIEAIGIEMQSNAHRRRPDRRQPPATSRAKRSKYGNGHMATARGHMATARGANTAECAVSAELHHFVTILCVICLGIAANGSRSTSAPRPAVLSRLDAYPHTDAPPHRLVAAATDTSLSGAAQLRALRMCLTIASDNLLLHTNCWMDVQSHSLSRDTFVDGCCRYDGAGAGRSDESETQADRLYLPVRAAPVAVAPDIVWHVHNLRSFGYSGAIAVGVTAYRRPQQSAWDQNILLQISALHYELHLQPHINQPVGAGVCSPHSPTAGGAGWRTLDMHAFRAFSSASSYQAYLGMHIDTFDRLNVVAVVSSLNVPWVSLGWDCGKSNGADSECAMKLNRFQPRGGTIPASPALSTASAGIGADPALLAASARAASLAASLPSLASGRHQSKAASLAASLPSLANGQHQSVLSPARQCAWLVSIDRMRRCLVSGAAAFGSFFRTPLANDNWVWWAAAAIPTKLADAAPPLSLNLLCQLSARRCLLILLAALPLGRCDASVIRLPSVAPTRPAVHDPAAWAAVTPTVVLAVLGGLSVLAITVWRAVSSRVAVKHLPFSTTPHGTQPSGAPPPSPPMMAPGDEAEPGALRPRPRRASNRLRAIRAVDGTELPFVPGQSSVGPSVPENRGLYVADGATISPGSIFQVHISKLVSFPRPQSEDEATHEQWESDMETSLKEWMAKGYYAIPLDTKGLRRDEPLIFRPSHGPAVEMLRWQVEQFVTITSLDPPTFALMRTDDSPFNLLNDAAYSPECTEEQYLDRLGRNHAEFVIGISADGVHRDLYMRFHHGATGGEEVYATYGWEFWAGDGRPPERAQPVPDGSELAPSQCVLSAQPEAADWHQLRQLTSQSEPSPSTHHEEVPSSETNPILSQASSSGYRGVAKCGSYIRFGRLRSDRPAYRGRFRAFHGCSLIGYFDTATEAACSYMRHVRSSTSAHDLAVTSTSPRGVELHLSSTSDTGYRGVSKRSQGDGKIRLKGAYRARLGEGTKGIIGYFDTAVDAAEAYALAVASRGSAGIADRLSVAAWKDLVATVSRLMDTPGMQSTAAVQAELSHDATWGHVTPSQMARAFTKARAQRGTGTPTEAGV